MVETAANEFKVDTETVEEDIQDIDKWLYKLDVYRDVQGISLLAELVTIVGDYTSWQKLSTSKESSPRNGRSEQRSTGRLTWSAIWPIARLP